MKISHKSVVDTRLVWALSEVQALVPVFQDNRAEYPFSRKLGICGNVYAALKLQGLVEEDIVELMEGMRGLIAQWPARDKLCDFYPVGGYDEYHGESHIGKLWFNERRLGLLSWLIKAAAERTEHDLARELAS